MNKKLYVGNLPFDAQESTLMEMFGANGAQVVKAQIISDRDTGRSRGFGFVEFENADDAQKAIDEFNGKDLGGRALTVNEAKEQVGNNGGSRGGYDSRPSSGDSRGGRGNGPSRW